MESISPPGYGAKQVTNYRTLTWPSQATPIMVTVQLNDAKAFWTFRKYKLHTTDHTYVIVILSS